MIERLEIYESEIGVRTINFHEGVNFLAGENGVGKSTILKILSGSSDAEYAIFYKDVELNLSQNIETMNNSLGDGWTYPYKVSWQGHGFVKGNTSSTVRLPQFQSGIFRGSMMYSSVYNNFYLIDGDRVSIGLSIADNQTPVLIENESDLYESMYKNLYIKSRKIINKIFIEGEAADREEKKVFLEKNYSKKLELFNNAINSQLAWRLKSINRISFSKLPLNENYDVDKNQVEKLVDFVDKYDTKRKIDNLSSGQKRSIATAIGIDNFGKTLLFDEPSNFLSQDMKRRFAKDINNLKQVIIATHDFDLINLLYKALPNIIKMKFDSIKNIDLKAAQEEYGSVFNMSNNSLQLAKCFFASKTLIVEGPDDMRMIKHNKQLSMLLDEENIEIFSAQGFHNLIKVAKFFKENELNYICFADNDVKDKDEGQVDIFKTKETNIEDYWIDGIHELFEDKEKKISRGKSKVRKLYSEGKLLYKRELFDEIWGCISDRELPEEYEFTWV